MPQKSYVSLGSFGNQLLYGSSYMAPAALLQDHELCTGPMTIDSCLVLMQGNYSWCTVAIGCWDKQWRSRRWRRHLLLGQTASRWFPIITSLSYLSFIADSMRNLHNLVTPGTPTDIESITQLKPTALEHVSERHGNLVWLRCKYRTMLKGSLTTKSCRMHALYKAWGCDARYGRRMQCEVHRLQLWQSSSL